MEALWWLAAQLLWLVWAILSWLLVQLLWLVLWAAVPLALAAVVCALVAERIIGKEAVRSWIRQHVSRAARAAWHRARGTLLALAALPVRVLGWFVIYTLLHTLQSLWWTPRWRPWQRAWDCRWGRKALAVARA